MINLVWDKLVGSTDVRIMEDAQDNFDPNLYSVKHFHKLKEQYKDNRVLNLQIPHLT